MCRGRQRAVGVVGDGERARPGRGQALDHRGDLGRAPRLADRHHEEAAVVDRRLVERVQAGRGERDRAAGRRFQQVAAVDRGVVGGAARD